MTSPQDNPPQQPKVSRLAITSMVLVASSLFLSAAVLGDNTFPFPELILTSIFCLVLTPLFGVAALVAIKRSFGQLVGNGIAVGTLVIATVLFSLWLLPSISDGGHRPRGKSWTYAMIQALCVASKSYNNEYGHWPQPRSNGDLVLIFNGLRDPRTDKDISGSRPDLLEQNPRRIQFMEFKLKDVTPHGKPEEELAFYDPWGTPYGFAFDNGVGGVYYLGPGTNNPVIWRDGKANDNCVPEPFVTTNATVGVIPGGYAFFSNGPDGRTGTTPGCQDDIRSWR